MRMLPIAYQQNLETFFGCQAMQTETAQVGPETSGQALYFDIASYDDWRSSVTTMKWNALGYRKASLHNRDHHC